MTPRLVVTAPARLDATTGPAVEAELRRCADAGPDVVVLDMAASLMTDSVGRGRVHGAQYYLRSRGVRLEIHDPCRRVRFWLRSSAPSHRSSSDEAQPASGQEA